MIEFPIHAPLDEVQKQQLGVALATLSPEQVAWVSGYMAGLQASPQAATALTAPVAPAADRLLTVLYGTESGNSEELAEQLLKAAKQKGFKAKVTNMADASPSDLEGLENLLVVVSTWGDGEPPEAAEEFYNDLMNGSVDLSGVKFSVCALGDTSYDQFCQTGKEVDARLEKLGASRLLDRVDCDVDFEDRFASWATEVWSTLGDAVSAPASVGAPAIAVAAPVYDKKNPFPSEILENQLLSGDRSLKETIHVELSLEGSGLSYQPGDVLAVLPRNADDVVSGVLRASGLNPDAKVVVKDIGEKSLEHALTVDYDITGLSRKIAASWQELVKHEELGALLAEDAKENFKTWVDGRQIVDLLEAYPANDLDPQAFVDLLRKLPPRLYSIASSPKAHPGEVHLTVAAVRYESYDKERKGVASTFLADDAPVGTKVSVYMHHNKNFRLPENGDTPIIMVGPGTGVAPFRAFVEERSEDGSKGDSWLFFGDQCYNEDFLYQLEWQDHLKQGSLTRLDVAFSRDQPEKVYVQHKMLERAAELWLWLERGAHFYVCGDASRMAKDVHAALLQIVQEEGGKSEAEAEAYLAALKKDKRYQRDVY
ncbi:assimilatory sulfite reductase (NADPH) flavoprotein subunit [Verrucomicrobiaceae bacterium N1E253]|uniref:assimilatory sulfite reductase (NADPH) n=1 Tax=Oceaniferula marina TaxID=2748318 RepID=A0A851GIN6_9BACT|nr:assimilatory sulfite reductase (NADPH) flavoprotein subunit [Oceaniferula marina]NWK57363.1 assimilatory sulfite reductase (NADPH) flavoprotein subunit [Oceaniferula marina]